MHEWNGLVVVHAVAATLAIVLGAANLARKPRGDAAHRLVGRTWLVLMYFVAGSSFWIQQIRPGAFSWIHGLSAFTIVTLTLGWWFGHRGNRFAHAANMIGTYIGLWGALIGVVAVPSRLVPQAFQDSWWSMTVLVAGVIAIGLGLVLVVTRTMQRRAASLLGSPYRPAR